MIVDPRPLALRAEDRAATDLQELNVRLSDCLASADRAIGALLESLAQAHDLIDGRRRAKIWGVEAQTAVAEAIETREQLAREQRAAGLMSDRWTVPHGR